MTSRPGWCALLLGAAFFLLPACGHDEKGACVPRAAPDACGDDYTSGQCDVMNGDFHPGKKCSDIGH